MKRQLRFILPALLAIVFSYTQTWAQTVQANVHTQPDWGPAGYSYVSYYYLPAAESYYSVNSRKFIYLEGGRWIARPYLPYKFKKYNLYSGYKVVCNQPRPYLNFTNDRIRYGYYKTYKNKQKSLRDKHNLRYLAHKKEIKTGKNKPVKKHPHKLKNRQTDFIAEN